MEFITYRNRIAHVQGLNPYQEARMRASAAKAAETKVLAAQWHDGDPIEGIAEEITDGDYLIPVAEGLASPIFLYHVSKRAWFERLYEPVPAQDSPPNLTD